jgi:hypothetical protein
MGLALALRGLPTVVLMYNPLKTLRNFSSNRSRFSAVTTRSGCRGLSAHFSWE